MIPTFESACARIRMPSFKVVVIRPCVHHFALHFALRLRSPTHVHYDYETDNTVLLRQARRYDLLRHEKRASS